MRCFVEFVSVPTADTPGTLLFLHFDDRRYLIGRLSEGSSRACAERGTALRKVSDVLLTGKTEWANVGGLLGTILGLADAKIAAKASTEVSNGGKLHHDGATAGPDQPKAPNDDQFRLNIYGGPNLNHFLATSRRFIFRTGMPLKVTEFGADDAQRAPGEYIQPTFTDRRILAWVMPIVPSSQKIETKDGDSPVSSRKRVFEETSDDTTSVRRSSYDLDQGMARELRKSIVEQMFNSSWRYDRLVPQSLSDIRGPTVCYVRDAETNQLRRYEGPMPGGEEPVPDITVLAREPWPGAATTHIPPTQPAQEAISYIIRNHPQRGKFMPNKAKDLKVPKGHSWSQLANGTSVTNANGETITPDMVLQPGKQGGGFAVIDLPSRDYLEPLLERAEWQTQDIMDGIEAVIWILGPGLSSESRLRQFMEQRSHMKHVVSSPDCCPNVLALEKAATNALLHNLVDEEIFPNLEWDNKVSSDLPQARTARPGQAITLEPKVDYEDDRMTTPFNQIETRANIERQLQDIKGDSGSWASEELPLDKGTQVKQTHGDVEVIVLGTGSSHPSKYRNVSGTLVHVPGWGSCLLDCGEGTLNTLRRMYTTIELESVLADLKMIWISHMHADHHLGLTSVVKAWNDATIETKPGGKLAVVSDAPMLHWLHEYSSVEELRMSRILPFATTPVPGVPRDKARAERLAKQGTSLRFVTPRSTSRRDLRSTSDIINQLDIESLNTVYVNHCRGAQAISIVFKSGFKLSYSGDCRPSVNFTLIGRGSHVLIHEATLQDDMRAEAMTKKHSTAGEALIVANEMQAEVCLLTHFSQRYPTMPPLGVKVLPEVPGAQVQQLALIFEDKEDREVAETGAAENDGLQMASATDTGLEGDGASLLTRESRRLEVIDEHDITRLVEKSGLKVVFAFDYMRFKLDDIPRLEMKQHVLRRIYDQGIAQSLVIANDAEDTDAQHSEGPEMISRDEKKQQKRGKMAEERNDKSLSEPGGAEEKVTAPSASVENATGGLSEAKKVSLGRTA